MPRRKLALDDATRSKDLSGTTYIVTGANSGVGLETTRQLVRQGGHVVMACRRVDAGQGAADSFAGLKGTHEVMRLDLADLQSVRDFVAEFTAEHPRLDGLACNAGMVNMRGDLERTKDGFETTIGVSYFGHFLLTELLLDSLRATAPSRMAIVSSVVHAGSPKNRPELDLDDLNYERREFNNMQAYAEAKVANVLYATELAERLHGTGVSAFSVHPGWARSNFGSGGSLPMRILMSVMRPFSRFVSDSNQESAQTTLHCLLSDDAPNHSGAYFSQSSILYRDKQCRAGGWPMETPNPNARNLDTARRLVDLSYDLVALDKPTPSF
ncbi:MAG: SDR family NAD(P)-dependent oxidoreductase [Ilumatobacter sp.]|uniref:SDR family NAD(P)-dependent oxidoreductase n=1 Tax=Ilumatobacter sp. TaxID=1967498 RepID=UPI00261D6961|nr:SDR family NAD(P)-dependent oxidoreductase [Ilumatobacter sp.]MDJ0769492.1 SDR family NAD(P)-dependent oxidoreductase [Ilumatobacter sp.]